MKNNERNNRLRLFIDREGISQIELAESLGKDPSAISKYCAGKLAIPHQVLKTLHLKYRLNFNWFFMGTGTMKVNEKEPRRITTDLTDILASIGLLIAAQEGTDKKLDRLVRDFYAAKHGV